MQTPSGSEDQRLQSPARHTVPSSDNRLSEFRLISLPYQAEIVVRVATSSALDFRHQMHGIGFQFVDDADRARSGISEVLRAVAENQAVWAALGGAVIAFLRRHRGKRVCLEIDGRTVSLENYAEADVQRLLNKTTKGVGQISDVRLERRKALDTE